MFGCYHYFDNGEADLLLTLTKIKMKKFDYVSGLQVKDYSALTFAMIKPDAFEKKDAIEQDIRKRGYEIVLEASFQMSEKVAKIFYSEHVERPFFPGLIKQMTAGPVVALLLRKDGDEPCFQAWRKDIGATNPAEAAEGTLRNIYADVDGYKKGEKTNCFHGSDSELAVVRESLVIFGHI